MKNAIATLLFFATVGAAFPAAAAVPVYEGENTTASVLGLTRVGYRVTENDGDVAGQSFLRFGRIGTIISHEGLGRAIVVGEFAGGAQLLDIIGEATLFDPIVLRAGFYKSPLSLEFDTTPQSIPFVGRTALLGRVAPARLTGTELEINLGDEAFSVEGRVGLWNPAPLPLRNDVYAGQYIIPKVGFHIGGFGQVHIAYLEHVFADNPTIPAERPAPYDRQLDFGVWIEPNDKLRVIAEGLVAFEGPDGEAAYAAHVQGYYRIGDYQNGIAWAPALAYDFVDDVEAGEEHTGRVGLNVHLKQLNFVLGAYYGGLLNTDTEILSHTGELQLQAEF